MRGLVISNTILQATIIQLQNTTILSICLNYLKLIIIIHFLIEILKCLSKILLPTLIYYLYIVLSPCFTMNNYASLRASKPDQQYDYRFSQSTIHRYYYNHVCAIFSNLNCHSTERQFENGKLKMDCVLRRIFRFI